MTKEELSNALHTIRINYPNSFNSFTDGDSAELLNIWYAIFKDMDSADVYGAIVAYIKSGAVFAPNAGQILNLIGKEKIGMIDSEEMWQKVKKFLMHMNNDDSDWDAYNKLPEQIRATYSLSELHAMGKNDSTQNDTYERPRFNKAMETYRSNTIQKAITSKSFGEDRKEIEHGI